MGDARFVELYERHYRHVYAYCRRRTSPERVEDAVADTFTTVWRKIGVVPSDSSALPWIYAVAHRVLGHQWRGASRQAKLRTRLDAVGVVTPALPEELIIVDQESKRIETTEEAEVHSFAGSPTVLIDGLDPWANNHLPIGLACRTYPTDEGLEPSPTMAAIESALGV